MISHIVFLCLSVISTRSTPQSDCECSAQLLMTICDKPLSLAKRVNTYPTIWSCNEWNFHLRYQHQSVAVDVERPWNNSHSLLRWLEPCGQAEQRLSNCHNRLSQRNRLKLKVHSSIKGTSLHSTIRDAAGEHFGQWIVALMLQLRTASEYRKVCVLQRKIVFLWNSTMSFIALRSGG